MVLADIRNRIDNGAHFFLTHKSCRTIGTFTGITEVSLLVQNTSVAVAHPHDHYGQNDNDADANAETVESVWIREHGTDAGDKSAVRKRGDRTIIGAGSIPILIVAEKLSDETAPV